MAGGVPNMDQFELYFKRADLDQDGRISGAEAVSFFKASGLPTPVLAQIWTHADQNRTGYLARAEFYNALKLVTVAQSKRDLTSEIVKAALYGPASAKIPAPQINLGALPASQSNLTSVPHALQIHGSTPVASHGTGIKGPQGYQAQQSQDIRPLVTALPNSTFQPQHGASHGLPSGHTVSVPRPSTSGVSNTWVGERTGGPAPHVLSGGLASSGLAASVQPRPQGPTSLSETVASRANGHTFAASETGAKDSSSPVAGNGSVSRSGFGDSFFPAPSQGKPNSLVPMSSAPALNVSSSNVHTPAGTQFSIKPSQFSQINIAHLPTAVQNQQTQSTLKYNQQNPAETSSTMTVRAENVPSSQSSQPWPKMTQSNVQKYTKVFEEVDTDKDGKITGEQARSLFLSWKMPIEILKQVWDLSDQDRDNMLSLKEFCFALYLMERYREGHTLPRTLPAGLIFDGIPLPQSGQPPAAYAPPAWRRELGVQQGHRMTAQRQVSHAAARSPRPVPVPIDEDVQSRQVKPRVPELEKHLVDQLSTEEQSSLNSKFQEATEADKKVGELEKEILEAKQKTEFYRSKMQELILYKSRCDNRLNEIAERISADRREIESLSKKYEDKYKQAGDVASKLTIEEATFRDIQGKKMELYRAIVKLDQDGKADDIQARVDNIQADLEEQVKALNDRCKMYGLRGKPTLLVELPFGWQVGIQEGAADWDENWDKFEDDGLTIVKELTLEVQNVIAPPKQKSLPVEKKSAFSAGNSTALSSSLTDDKSEKFPSDIESVVQRKDNSVKTPPDATIKATGSPSKIFQDSSSPPAVKTQSESVFLDERAYDEPGGTAFVSQYNPDASWDFNATNHKDTDQESLHGNTLFDSSDGWGLNPIRTEIPKKSTLTFDSVPSTPAYSYTGSPPGNNLFHNHGPIASSFADSVPSTPAYSNAGSPRPPNASAFADSVPSTPMFATDGPEDPSFNNISRFYSFRSSTHSDNFSRFDSFRSMARDSELDQGYLPPKNLTRFDSMNSSADFGHSLFPPRESFSRFDSMMKSTSDSSDFNHGFPSFDDADPFGSHDPFKTSVESETSRRYSADGWKAF